MQRDLDFAAPEPTLTPEAIIARAVEMRSRLLERQEECEQRTYIPESTHQEFLDAGFYRMIQPRRFGGYEFDIPTFLRVVLELARGCPSSAWCFSLASAHSGLVAAEYEAEVQAEIFGPDGDFRAASQATPLFDAQVVDGGYVIDGTWPYCSGAPISTHFIGQARLPAADPDAPPQMLMFVVPREDWELVDDWHGVLGLRGSGSHSIRLSNAFIPERFARKLFMLNLDRSEMPVGVALHQNPMYGMRILAFFQSELCAVAIGAAWAAIDEYVRIITGRPAGNMPATMRNYETVKSVRADREDYQRWLGIAMGRVAMAESALMHTAHEIMRLSTRAAEEGIPYTLEDDLRMLSVSNNAARIAWETTQDILVRTAGSTAAKDGQRMQRYFRDIATFWSHIAQAQSDAVATNLARLHLGYPLNPV